jgi:enoyl-CoA hydratase/carnithine racemase
MLARMRYLLTAERFDADTALRAGLVTEVVPEGSGIWSEPWNSPGFIAANASRAPPRASARFLERRTPMFEGR